MNLTKYIYFVIALVLFSSKAKSAAPNWTVNAASFQYSMTLTAKAELNCTNLSNPSNKIAVFVNGQLRGVANTSNVVNGAYIATMTVYSNTTSSEKISFKFYNAANDSIYNGVDSILFQENAAYGTVGSPYIVKNNNAPTAMMLSNSSVNEGLAINSNIGNFSTTDSDLGETFTYTLVSGTGSTDNANFNISGGTLRTNAVLNYTSKTSHNIRVRSTDANGCFFEQTFTISVNDVNTAPTEIFISDSTVNENSPALTIIGSFSTLDNDLNDTYTYSLVSGAGSTNNASFNINGLNLRTTASFNYEVKSSYSIRVRVTDGASNSFDRVFTILIDDINDSPTDIKINNSATGTTFAENKPLGSLIGYLFTTDEDAANTFNYSFVSITGNNNSDFAIVGNQLRTNSLFDFETRQNYVVFVQTNDGMGGLFTKQLLLQVVDSNDAPSAINLTNTSIAENLPANSFVAKLSANDPDAASVHTFSLVNGSGSSGNNSFTIRNDSLFTNSAFDFESVSSYSIRLNVSDGMGGTFQQSFTISILNANDTPTDININSNQIAENLAANTVIGTLATADQDATNTFIYTLVSGAGSTDNASFNLAGNSLRSSTSFDFETKNLFSVRVRTTDNGGAYFEKVLNIQVTDVIDAPTNILISNDSISENMTANTFIGNLTGVSQDASPSFTFTFNNNMPGNDNSSFVLVGNQLRSNASFDFETKNVYTLYVTASSGASTTYSKIIQIYIRNQNDAPTDISLSLNTIKENRPAGSFIGIFTSADADANSSFTYSLVNGIGGTDNANFLVRNDSLYTASILDFETKNSFSIRAQTIDNGNANFQKVFTIMVSDSNDAPTSLSLSTNSLNENLSAGSVIASLSTVDSDAGQTHSYSLVGGLGSDNNNMFNIVGSQLRSSASFNYELKNSYKIRIQTNDGNGGTYSDTFSIYVLNANDAPTNISLSNDIVVENRPLNSLVGTLNTTDEDAGNFFSYSFLNIAGNDNAAFYINGNQLRTNAQYDFESKQIYNVFIQTSDGLASFSKQFVINISDSNDAPTNVVLSNNSVDENLTANSFVGMLYSTDADANNTFTYSLVAGNGSTNNGNFIIRNDSLLTAGPFNYEAKSTYSIRIRTSDNGQLFFEKQFQITINDANDVPTDISLSSNEIVENRSSRTFIGTFSTTDQDPLNTYSYSFAAGNGDSDNVAFVIIGNELRSNRVFNYESKNTFSIRVQSNDGNGGTVEKVFNVLIADSNDAPTNIILSTQTVAENLPIASKVCDISTIDQDAGDAFTYSFANVTGNNNSNFFIIGNELRTNNIFDFETKNFYIVVLTATDASGSSFSKQFVIQIKDSVDAPTALELGDNSVSENMPIGEVVGTFTASDADQFSGFNYSLVSGVGSIDNSNFSIVNDTLYANVVFNFEAKKTYSIRVRVTDVTNATFERAFSIQVTDANDAPTAILLSNNTLQENKQALTEIGLFTTSDVDANESHKYTLVTGVGSTDNAFFIIEGNTLRSNFSANFEAKNTYSVRVATTDNGGSVLEDVFVINVVDISEKPSINDQEFNVSENDSIGTIIGTLVSNSPDAAANLVYSSIGLNPFFAIDSTNGNISVKQKIDYEKNDAITLVIVVTDLQAVPLYDTAIVTIYVKDEIEVNQPLPVNNYLSPNGDGLNDFFSIDNPELYKDYSLSVYNESGMEVYSISGNYQNNWDGTYNGTKLPTGVYFYVFNNSKTGDKFRGALNIVNQ
ncbi:MAG: cadherin domain-containing protein [Bacteroidia bacterium]|nr:cadherin domain-containing protein [Bacteroidia bacterium]